MVTLKKYLPRSLFWRSVLIVVLPMIVLQVVLAYLIVQRHFDGVTRQLTEGVASELSYVVAVADQAPTADAARAELGRASRTLGFPIALVENADLPRDAQPVFFDVTGRAVEGELRDRIDAPLFVAVDREDKLVDVRAQTRHGVLSAVLPRRRMIASNPHLLLTWMAATATALIAISLIYLRNQIKPIQALAGAAEAFGKGRTEPLRVAGAEEVRSATAAFLDMRARIERHIEQRTRMLSGVSHDMRTPLTRMKLALEMMGSQSEIEELRHDVAELELILDEFLAYARGDQAEAVQDVDVVQLAETVVAEAARTGRVVAFDTRIAPGADSVVRLKPVAIKRCLHNLVENALTFGQEVQIAATVAADEVEIVVEDDGPGIPAERREEAAKPFQRLDDARNRNQNRGGGVGLGLALAIDAVHAHGGTLALEESAALGGLRAVVRLPR